MQIVSSGDNLHEMSNPIYLKNKKNILKYCMSNADEVQQVKGYSLTR